MSSLVSVIVPVYNVEQYLDKCVESIINQTYGNIEIILVDDGSSDMSPYKCDEWRKKDSRVKVIHQSNQGVSVARNTGIEASTGEYLCFVDSDDYIENTLCERSINVFNDNDVEIVSFGVNQVKNDRIIPYDNNLEGCFSSIQALHYLLKNVVGNYVWKSMYKKTIFNSIRFPVNRNFEDIGITYKLFLEANNIYFIKDLLYFYRYRSNSITNDIDFKSNIDLFLMRKNRYDYLKKIYPDIAEYDLNNVAIMALVVFDYSCFAKVDPSILREAKLFLEENERKIRANITNKYLRFYYLNPKLYGFYRTIRYKVKLKVKKNRVK